MKDFLHKLKYDRKGIAIEMAITLLIVTFALSTLVLTTSLLQYKHKVKAQAQMPRTIALEQIGETFCTSTAAGIAPEEWTGTYPDYRITVDGLSLTVCDPVSDSVLLTVTLQYDGINYTVTQWSYN